MSIKPSVTTKKGLDEHTKKMWQRQYSSPKTTSGKFCKKHSPTTLLCPAIFGESRSKQVTLSKVRLDKLNLKHKRFQENLHPMDPSDTCYKSESTDHVLMEFPRYGEERRDIHKNISQITREKKNPHAIYRLFKRKRICYYYGKEWLNANFIFAKEEINVKCKKQSGSLTFFEELSPSKWERLVWACLLLLTNTR
ncbi:hypothetical protein DAPPUDRAFT_114604 [Daphnia pulex]|uniref:Uncharacterized protein n=1 Tax=Daphnia pulex TaxID=6669 RepID=E9HIQ4_DAPPU|nr:hypothetical protein DAPPUDRAFT_114604 [Daphnia pulex]|eukprot:EFX68398.1 hypothetical protein DAPPUDRAFT_114604 [Daphnia pulex]